MPAKKKAKSAKKPVKKIEVKDLASKKGAAGGWATFPSSVKWEGPDFDAIRTRPT